MLDGCGGFHLLAMAGYVGDLYGVMLATSEPGRALVRYTQADRTIVSAVHAHGWRTRRSETAHVITQADLDEVAIAE